MARCLVTEPSRWPDGRPVKHRLLRLQRAWSLAEAEKLDSGRGEFSKALREALLEAIDALHEKAALNPD
jgi:hypothetical protein